MVLAGIELIFFIVPRTRLCFGFVLKKELIIQGCFSYCWAVLTQCQGLFCFSHRPNSEWAGGAQKAGKGHIQDADPNWPQGYSTPYDVMLSTKKLGEAEGRGGCSELWSPDGRVMEPCCHGNGWMPAEGKQWMNSLFCFACMPSFFFTYETVFISAQKFSYFYRSGSVPQPTGAGSEGPVVWYLAADWS